MATTVISFIPLSRIIRFEYFPLLIVAFEPLTVTVSIFASVIKPSTVTVSRFIFSPLDGLSIVSSGASVSKVTKTGVHSPVTRPSNFERTENSLAPSIKFALIANFPSSPTTADVTTSPFCFNSIVVVGEAVPVIVVSA